MPLSPLVRFGTSSSTDEGWHSQVYLKEYAKTTFARECLIVDSMGFPPLQEYESVDLYDVLLLASLRTGIERTPQ